MKGTSLLAAISAALLLTVGYSAKAASKTDQVFLANGDRFTGEIKRLNFGRLKLNTDDIGEIYIEWDKIVDLRCTQLLELETEAGLKSIGHISSWTSDGMVTVTDDSGEISVSKTSIVRITPIETNFRDAIKGFLDIGFVYARDNRTIQWTSGLKCSYRTRRSETELEGESFFSDSETGESSSRNSLALTYNRFPGHKLIIIGNAEWYQNQVMDIDNRYSLGGHAGVYLVQTTSTFLSVTAGINSTVEERSESGSTEENLEAIGAAEFSTARYDEPELDFSAGLKVFPSLSSDNRVRVEFQSRLKYEILHDFFIGFYVPFDYDSRASDGGGSTTDWSVETSVGWSF